VRVRDERAVVGRAGDPGEAEAARRLERGQRLPGERASADSAGGSVNRLMGRRDLRRSADRHPFITLART
jgi:hypothetical protein